MSATHHGFFNTSGTRTHVRFQFSTHAATGGNVAPLSAFEAADLRIYKAADSAAFSATQRSSANGITMTSPFDSLAGFHDVDIDLTDNTDSGFYAAGSLYCVVLAPDTETVDGQTITGVVLAYFEIGVMPVNVAQFGGSNGTFASGRPEVNTTHAAGTAWGSGAITAGALAADAITAAKLAADVGAEIADAVWDEALSGHLGAGSAGEALDAAGSGGGGPSAATIADAVWDEALAGHVGAGSAGEALGFVPSDAAGVSDLPDGEAFADSLLGRNIGGGSNGGRTVTSALRVMRNKVSISAGTLTVTEEDDSTPAWTAAVTTAAGDPLTEVDPA